MRFLVSIAVALIAATPAVAQRIDTRRIDIREMTSSTLCTFNAYRELTLVDASKEGRTSVARWKAPSEIGDPRPAHLEAIFTASKGRWSDAPFLGIAFIVDGDEALSKTSVSGARAVIDEEAPVDLLYHASGERMTFPVGGDPGGFGRQLIDGDTVRLEVLGKDGAVIRSYRWNVKRFDEVVEVVSIVGWSCTSP
ncbi:hypothetical protein P1X14_09665 [Sphingomonas sp. AOB5]|uniref:hypothetical protein n=1 Tax=Sphingomonas sp. AOB5 TaxID=3034017 RepID=UPI0023F9DFA7|nr:hypothetical protein [Sphingomonas sp. AOB5]MDF7775513.1 hypothetical protein [Sphingomonas sp. AOB5]